MAKPYILVLHNVLIYIQSLYSNVIYRYVCSFLITSSLLKPHIFEEKRHLEFGKAHVSISVSYVTYLSSRIILYKVHKTNVTT